MIPPKKIFKGDARHDALRLACCLVGVACVASAQSDSMDLFDGDPSKYSFLWIPADSADWTRHFHIGGVVGLNISANFSMSGKFPISGNNAASGVYDDGYVRVDQTGNAGGATSFWGYNNASQYNPSGGMNGSGTLAMHSSTSFTATGDSKDNGGPFPGFDMVYGDNLWYWKHARVGWEFGFGLLPVTIKDHQSMPASVNQSTYTFDTHGIVIPNAPYQGGPSGNGPIISGSPESVTSDTVATGTVTGDRSLDVMIYTIRFGPSFYWDLNEYLGFSLGAGPALGIVSGNYSYNENIIAGGITSHNTGSFGSTDVVFGGYVNGSLMYHILNDADLYLSAQYMPMGSVSFSDGGRESKLNLGGQVYISAGVSWPF